MASRGIFVNSRLNRTICFLAKVRFKLTVINLYQFTINLYSMPMEEKLEKVKYFLGWICIVLTGPAQQCWMAKQLFSVVTTYMDQVSVNRYTRKLLRMGSKHQLFQISVVSDCTVKRLGDLPFVFDSGTCGTFIINGSPTILLCFSRSETKLCRSLIKRNKSRLSKIKDFVFDTEFEVNRVYVPDSTHDHYGATLINYQGFPLVLGGQWGLGGNNKLEILNTMENPLEWVEYEGTHYPYSNT